MGHSRESQDEPQRGHPYYSGVAMQSGGSSVGPMSVQICDEMLGRIEKFYDDPIRSRQPLGSTNLFLVPIDMMHELLMVWKMARTSGDRTRITPLS